MSNLICSDCDHEALNNMYKSVTTCDICIEVYVEHFDVKGPVLERHSIFKTLEFVERTTLTKLSKTHPEEYKLLSGNDKIKARMIGHYPTIIEKGMEYMNPLFEKYDTHLLSLLNN